MTGDASDGYAANGRPMTHPHPEESGHPPPHRSTYKTITDCTPIVPIVANKNTGFPKGFAALNGFRPLLSADVNRRYGYAV